MHTVVAKRTFGSENAQNTSCSEHFLPFWCRKIAGSCGEKRIWKWKCRKHPMLGTLFDVLMSKKLHAAVAKSTLWSQNAQKLKVREHFLKFWCRKIARRCGEQRILKWACTKHVSSGQFEVLMSKSCMNLWREVHLSVKIQNTCVLARFFKFRCRTISQVVS